ncbi:penicillin-binding protein 1B [Vreelandella utahensis]|uniref:penicillin-binding protein 1B n=1 Tax=Vreelandella halophila TaxID=86177 RepID=UPI00098423E5|nr:penicillin-binding protein 1B [Halomonas utahensis]
MTKRAGSKQEKRRGRRFIGLIWRLGLVGLLVLVAWTIYLDVQVTSRFEDHRWEIPSRVYAQPLELYAGAPVGAEALTQELDALGYQAVSGAPRAAGQFQRRGGRFRIRTRGFQFPDGREPARNLRITAEGGTITRFEAPGEASLARLEPRRIASIYPGHGEDRVLVQLDDQPELFRETLLTVEDRGFQSHYGVEPTAIARAFIANLQAGRVVQGGSTLTQQLVKNFWLSSEQTYWRKFNEAIMAILLELRYSKEAILEAYMNEAYLGQSGTRAIHGFGLASRFWFAKPFSELELHETALLVGMVRGPGYYNPRTRPEQARARRDLVLDLLADQGVITESRASSLKRRTLDVAAAPDEDTHRYPAFMDLVREHLSRDYRDEDLETAGLRVFTTLNPRLQAAAESRASGMMAALEQGQDTGALEGAVVITGRESGEVEALVGGRNTRFPGFNRAMNASRPIGSLVKPATYLTALEQPARYTLISPLKDEPFRLEFDNGDTWSPANFGGEPHGQVPLHRALSHSYNQASVRLGLDLGVPAVGETLKRLGMEGEPPQYPSMLLGSVEMTPLEVARMYQTIASGGFRMPLRSIRSVTTPEGEVLSRYDLDLEQVVEPGPMHLLHYGMQEVMREGTGSSVYNLIPERLHTAGKTGTTNEGRDSWFAGFTGSHLGVVWVGGDDYDATTLTGSSGALQIWGRIMADSSTRAFSPVVPGSVDYHWVDAKTGGITAEGCEGARRIPFIQGSEPQEEVPCSDGMGNRIQRWFQQIF